MIVVDKYLCFYVIELCFFVIYCWLFLFRIYCSTFDARCNIRCKSNSKLRGCFDLHRKFCYGHLRYTRWDASLMVVICVTERSCLQYVTCNSVWIYVR